MIKKAFVKSFPVMAGYVILGIGFGILAYENNLGIFWPLFMSIAVFSGTMQYLAVSLISAGASIVSIVVSVVVVHVRFAFYGISMLKKYKGAPLKWYMIFSMTDETYAICVNNKTSEEFPKTKEYQKFCLILSVMNQCYWVTGTLIGLLVGRFIPFDFKGIDFALTALFISVVVDQCLEAEKSADLKSFVKAHFATLVGVVCSVISLVIFGADDFIVPSMIGIVVLLCAPKFIEKMRKDSSDASKNKEDDEAEDLTDEAGGDGNE